MEVEGTRVAFERMLEVPGLYRILGVDTSTVANWKRYLREGKLVSLDKMEEMLLRFGAKVKQEKVWGLPEIGVGVLYDRLVRESVEALIAFGLDGTCKIENGNYELKFKQVGKDGIYAFQCDVQNAFDAMFGSGLNIFLSETVGPKTLQRNHEMDKR